MRQWRLIYDLPASGADNMIKDEAILAQVSAEDGLPTLRFYAWNPPCLSLGYAQKSDNVDFERIESLGWDVVRRPTGGRAILHMHELTYSVTLPLNHPLAAGNVIESYQRISLALTAGLKLLGVESLAERRTEHINNRSAICFETPSHYEITIHGRKLIGSAQARRKEGILQHGSIPLFGDMGRICDVLRYPDEDNRERAKAQVRKRAITLSDALDGQMIEWRTAAQALAEGFAQTFRLTFNVQDSTKS